MITKGTTEYTAAQELANKIQRVASYERWNNNTLFNLYFDPFANFLTEIEKVEGFASQVAKTIEEKMNPYGNKVANVSSKQAWIIACTAVENNITLN
jgi:hypothetical protein